MWLREKWGKMCGRVERCRGIEVHGELDHPDVQTSRGPDSPKFETI